jgi:hypothetical protein
MEKVMEQFKASEPLLEMKFRSLELQEQIQQLKQDIQELKQAFAEAKSSYLDQLTDEQLVSLIKETEEQNRKDK